MRHPELPARKSFLLARLGARQYSGSTVAAVGGRQPLSDSSAEFAAAQDATAALRQAVELRGRTNLTSVPWRALLNDLLAARATRCRHHVDALVIAIQQISARTEGRPITAADLTAWAASASIEAPLATFAAAAWSDVLDLHAAAAVTEIEAPTVPPDEPVAVPPVVEVPGLAVSGIAVHGGDEPGDLTTVPAPVVIPGDLTGALGQQGEPGQQGEQGGRRRAGVAVVALALVVAIAAIAAASFFVFGDDDDVSSTTLPPVTTTSDPAATTDAVGANVVVPNLIGLSPAAARERLDEVGLESADGGDTCSALSGFEEGQVNSQVPSWNASVERSTVVTITIQRCDLTVRVPRVVEATVAAALVALDDRGLELGTTATSCVNSRAAGVVLAQDPRAGAEVAPGASVDITINDCSTVTTDTTDPTGTTDTTSTPTTGTTTTVPTNPTVPSLVGLSYATAEGRLAARGLEIRVSSSICDTAPDAPDNGVVLSQGTSAGTTVAPGTTISVVLQEC
jgi:beta-lactam-binding protein with PASTA domain